MRFALIGDSPDGLAMSRALVGSGRHELVAFTSAAGPAHASLSWAPRARQVHDLEELLADSEVEAVIVAGTPANRPAQLRRALQSDRHVLCVHPSDDTPNMAYEAGMLRDDTGRALVPLLPDALHPAVARLAQLVSSQSRPLVRARLVAVVRWSTAEVSLEPAQDGRKPCFPGWDVLRTLAGEIAEVSTLTSTEELEPDQPVLIAGRFESGLLFQSALLPFQNRPFLKFAVTGSHGQAELLFPDGESGPAFLTVHGADGQWKEEAWDAWDPWPEMVVRFEQAVAASAPRVMTAGRSPASVSVSPASESRDLATARNSAYPTWLDATRCLELDDAARRSTSRRRTSTLEYQEVSEEVGFKGTMTLVGCGLIWLVIAIVIVAAWYPQAAWVVLPLLLVFLGLQIFRWVLPRSRRTED